MARSVLNADKYRREAFQKIIKKKMIDLDLKQEELGELLGLKQSTVSERLNFKNMWDYEELHRLFEVLHFSQDEVLTVMIGVMKKCGQA